MANWAVYGTVGKYFGPPPSAPGHHVFTAPTGPEAKGFFKMNLDLSGNPGVVPVSLRREVRGQGAGLRVYPGCGLPPHVHAPQLPGYPIIYAVQPIAYRPG